MAPWCRVYGAERLPKLIAPYHLEKESYWIKNPENQWVACSKGDALDFVPRYDPNNAHGCAYVLGCFVLRKPC